MQLRMHPVQFSSWLANMFVSGSDRGRHSLFVLFHTISLILSTPIPPHHPQSSILHASHQPARPAARSRRQRPPQEEPQEEVGAAYFPLLAGGASAPPELAGRDGAKPAMITTSGARVRPSGRLDFPSHSLTLGKRGRGLACTGRLGGEA